MSNLMIKTAQQITNEMSFELTHEESLSQIVYGESWDNTKSIQYMLWDYYGDTNLTPLSHSIQEWYNLIIDFLPKDNLIFNWKVGSDEKVAGNTPKVLFPCFKGDGDGDKYIDLGLNATTIAQVNKIKIISKQSVETTVLIGGQNGSSYAGSYTTSRDFYDGNCGASVTYNIDRDTFCSGEWETLIIDNLDLSLWTILRFGYYEISGFNKYSGECRLVELYDNSNNILGTYNLTGHAYGFDANGNPIEGTPSDDNCFTGLCEYNPEEAYNFEDDIQPRNLVCPARRVSGEEHLE